MPGSGSESPGRRRQRNDGVPCGRRSRALLSFGGQRRGNETPAREMRQAAAKTQSHATSGVDAPPGGNQSQYRSGGADAAKDRVAAEPGAADVFRIGGGQAVHIGELRESEPRRAAAARSVWLHGGIGARTP